MRTSCKLALAATVIIVYSSSGPPLKAQGSVEQEVLQAQTARFEAALARDIKALDKLMATELWYCRPRGFCEDKEHFLHFASTSSQKLAVMKAMTMKVTPFGDTAIATGQVLQSWNDGNPAHDLHFFMLEFWVKRDGRWQLAKFKAIDPPGDGHRFADCKEAGDNFDADKRWIGYYYMGGTKSGAEKDVMRAQAERYRAILAGDPQPAAAVIADDLRYCHMSGQCEDKAQYMQTMAGRPAHIPAGLKTLELWTEQPKIDVYGDTATVVARVNKIVTIGSGKLRSHNVLLLEAYAKRNGRWQLTAAVESDVAGWSPTRCEGRPDNATP